MLSFICVYNNEKILEEYLLSSLKKQTVPYDLVLIDNTKGEFKSAAEALNFGASKSKGDYLVFIHQDISFTSKQSLEKLEEVLRQLPRQAIAGPAGVIRSNEKDTGIIFTNIMHGEPPTYAGSNRINAPCKVHSLDECMIVIPKEVFDILKFDGTTCNGWHLYGVDYCISASKMNITSYAIPVEVYHKGSSRSINNEYYLTLKKVARKHRSNIDYLYTTIGAWPTSALLLNMKITKISLKVSLKRFMNEFSIGRKLINIRRNLKQKSRS